MSNADNQAQIAVTTAVKLTRREIEILALVHEGQSSKNVAVHLFISKRTVDFHLDNIYDKLKVPNRMLACRRAVQLGLLNAL